MTMGEHDFITVHWRLRGMLMLMWFALGIIHSLPGPTLLLLACQTQTVVPDFVPVLLARSLGVLIGGLVVNVAAKFMNGLSLTFCGLMIVSIATSLIPFIRQFNVMTVIMLVIGLGCGASWEAGDIISNDSSWKRVNIQNLLYAAGAIVAPLLAENFLRGISFHDALPPNRGKNNMTSEVYIPLTSYDQRRATTGTYFTAAIPLYLLIIITLVLLLCRTPSPKKSDKSSQPVAKTKINSKTRNYMICLYLTTYFGVAFCIESVISVLAFSYAFLCGLSVSNALFINSLFWVAFLIGCSIAPFVSQSTLTTKKHQFMTFIKTAGILLSATILTASSDMSALVVGFVLMGICLACLTEATSSISEGCTLWLHNKRKLCFIARTLTDALVPYFTAVLMDAFGAVTLPSALMLFCLVLACLHVVTAVLAYRRLRDLQLQQYHNIDSEFEVEQERIQSRMHKEVNGLLGAPYDDLNYYTSDDEIVYDRERRK